MVKQITLTSKDVFSCEYFENNKLLQASKLKKHHVFDVELSRVDIKIKITPWKLQPDIRFDGHLVNYGLAEITPWDHMLEFKLEENYEVKYFKNIIKAKKLYLSNTGQNIPDNIESYVGVNNAHTDLVDQIKQLIK